MPKEKVLNGLPPVMGICKGHVRVTEIPVSTPIPSRNYSPDQAILISPPTLITGKRKAVGTTEEPISQGLICKAFREADILSR